jgi:hypothetical protein
LSLWSAVCRQDGDSSRHSLDTGRTARGKDAEPPTSRKRLREEAEAQEEQPCGESEAMVVWENVLDEFQRRLSLRPVVSQVKGQKSALCLEAEHIPLLQVLYLPSFLSPLSSVSEKKRRRIRNEESEPQRVKTGATMFLFPPAHNPLPPSLLT